MVSEKSKARPSAPVLASRREVRPFPQAISSNRSPFRGCRSLSIAGHSSILTKSFPSPIRSSQNRALLSQDWRALVAQRSVGLLHTDVRKSSLHFGLPPWHAFRRRPRPMLPPGESSNEPFSEGETHRLRSAGLVDYGTGERPSLRSAVSVLEKSGTPSQWSLYRRKATASSRRSWRRREATGSSQ